jgi:small-conductance mechanosensitive channel
MSFIFEAIKESMGISYENQIKILTTVLIILFLWVLTKISEKILNRYYENKEDRYIRKKTVTYINVTIALFLLIGLWFKNLGSLATYFGLLSAGIAIALKDTFSNMAGWFFILTRRPFKIGDRIELGKYKGDVIDIRLFQFTIMEIGNWVDADQSTGRIIHIPNSKIFSESIANYTRGFFYIWNEIPVLITFESNWEKAKKILFDIIMKEEGEKSKHAKEKLKEVNNKYLIHYNILTPTVYTTVKDSGVLLTVRYLCEPRKRRGSENDLWEKILKEFALHDDIDLAYPTQRFYNNLTEGKIGTKPHN